MDEPAAGVRSGPARVKTSKQGTQQYIWRSEMSQFRVSGLERGVSSRTISTFTKPKHCRDGRDHVADCLLRNIPETASPAVQEPRTQPRNHLQPHARPLWGQLKKRDVSGTTYVVSRLIVIRESRRRTDTSLWL